jgi:hypothetical protein
MVYQDRAVVAFNSLRNLGVLCVSAVKLTEKGKHRIDAEDAEVTQSNPMSESIQHKAVRENSSHLHRLTVQQEWFE